MSKMASSRLSDGVCAASSLPTRRCASARKPFRYERIGGLLDTVVDELVRTLQVLDQLQTKAIPEIRMDVLVRFPPRTIESIVISAMLPRQARCCKRGLGLCGQAGHFPTIRSTTLSVYPLA